MLAGHLGGIRHYKDREFLNAKHYDNVVAGLTIFQDDPLVSLPVQNSITPAMDSIYSAPQSRKRALRIFIPACRILFSLRWDCARQLLINRQNSSSSGRGFTHIGKASRSKTRSTRMTATSGPGEVFLSSSDDLVRFGNALLGPGYLKKESLALLFTSQKTTGGEETGYGMGWEIERSKSGKRIFAHSGGSTGASSQLILYPDQRLVVAMVCNYDTDIDINLWKYEEVQSIAEAFDGKSSPYLTVFSLRAIYPAILEELLERRLRSKIPRARINTL